MSRRFISKKKSGLGEQDLLDLVEACYIMGLMSIGMAWLHEVRVDVELRRTDPDYRIAREIQMARYNPVKDDISGECL